MNTHELDRRAPHHRGAWLYAGVDDRNHRRHRPNGVYHSGADWGHGRVDCWRAVGILDEPADAPRTTPIGTTAQIRFGVASIRPRKRRRRCLAP